MIKKLFYAFAIAAMVISTPSAVAAPDESPDPQAPQTGVCQGTVKDAYGEAVIGAGLLIKGTQKGTITDPDGNFTLPDLAEGDVIIVSCIGYTTKEIVWNGEASLAIVLDEDNLMLDEVVVTALGIERKAKSLTYATQKVGGNELTRSKETNLVNSLQGKTAGLVITPTASGAGGSSKMIIRGNKSANGNNQPLVVIDGMPMNNDSPTQLSSVYGGRDGGDALSNINPEDIQSINVLKGASAAALYGSMAANGVILITTKSGSQGKVRIDFSSDFTAENAAYTNVFQETYGAPTVAGQLSEYSWGDKISGTPTAGNRIRDFFQTGFNWINSVGISGGTEHSQTYVSYANTFSNGIMPTNSFMRHNMMLKQTFKALNDKLNITASLNYINQKAHNRPRGGQYDNPLNAVYSFPANGDWNYYKENYEVYDENLMYNVQNWFTDTNGDFQANPYWNLYRTASDEQRNRIMATGSVKYNFTDWLNVQARINYDRTVDGYQRAKYASTSQVLSNKDGQLETENYTTTQMYGDVMLNFNKTFGDFSINAAAGASITDYNLQSLEVKQGGDRYIPNYFYFRNSTKNGATNAEKRKMLQSVFGTAQFGWKDMLFLDVTARNDWSSTLAFTPNISYFYPSVGLTAVISDMVKMPEAFNLLKVRGSYSIVGNEMPIYITNPLNGFNNGVVTFNTTIPFTDMQPEKLHSIEAGFDLAMFDNRLSLDFTYYKTNNKNQYFSMNVPSATGYSSYYFNAGNIQNQGVELSINWNQKFGKDFSWLTGFNFSYNKNEIVELDNRIGISEADRLTQVDLGGMFGYNSLLRKGGEFGDLYAKNFIYHDGLVTVNSEGKPQYTPDVVKVGSTCSPINLGWNNTFTFKNWHLYFLIDGRIGGEYIDVTQAVMNMYGTSKETADARDAGGVRVYNQDTNSIETIEARTFYANISSINGGGGDWYVYSQTNFRLRELSLGYTFRDAVGNGKDITLNAVGRNLFFLYKNCPSDPDVAMSTNNGYGSMIYMALPSTRSYGLNVKITF